jgi:dihydroflavonol-4-reductase
MRPTLVTGANGHLGYNIVRLLVARGEPVRAMTRASADVAPLRRLGVDVVHADVLDADAVERAIAGSGRVYHTAAGFLMWAKDPERAIVAASVDGTRHVMRAAARAGVDKVLYVSTGGTVGFARDPDARLTETSYNHTPHIPYFKGKIAAEREAFAIGAAEKLAVTAINPGLILGPRFWKVSESTKQVVDILNQGLPLWFDGGFGVVDVEDVAEGAIRAMEYGRDGERYIVSGDNITVKRLADLVCELGGVAPPRLRAPLPVFRAIATAAELAGRATGRRPLIDRAQVDEFGGTYSFFDCTKAQHELGYRWRDARTTVARTVAWALAHGFVGERRRAKLRPSAALPVVDDELPARGGVATPAPAREMP